MKRIALPISLLLILALFTLACSLGGLTGGQGETPAATAPPGGATPAATTPPSGDEPTPVSGAGISYTSLGELDWINSYRYRFLMAWETLDEPQESSSMEMMWELVKDPAAQHFGEPLFRVREELLDLGVSPEADKVERFAVLDPLIRAGASYEDDGLLRHDLFQGQGIGDGGREDRRADAGDE